MGRSRSSIPTRRLLSRRGGLLSAAVVALAVLATRPYWRQAETPLSTEGRTEVVVERVVDGDTFTIRSPQKERVRLLGVDTPETVKPDHPVEPFGPEAGALTRQWIEGRSVVLEFDREKRDKYGRLLAYVWVDGKMLNEELLRQGLGRALLQYNFSAERKEVFRRAEAEARAARRGIWSLPQP